MRAGSFWFGLLIGLILTIVGAVYVLPMLGVFDITALGKPNILDWWGDTNLDKTLERRAPKTKIPQTVNSTEGFQNYKSTCLHCHGAPGAPRESWAKHMMPLPPHLQEEDTQKMPDGQLFYIISNGIRMTGMPAFSPDHSQDEIWSLVAMVRDLTNLSDDRKLQLQKASALFGQPDQGKNAGGNAGEKQSQ